MRGLFCLRFGQFLFFVVVFFFNFFFLLAEIRGPLEFFFACPAMPAVTNAFSYCAISL